MTKTIRKCVDDCGYNNLYLSSVFSRVFSLKTTPYTLPNRDFRETVAKIIAWHDSSSSSHVLYMWPFCRLLLTRHLRAKYEIHLIIFSNLILHRSLTLIPYNQTHILTGKKIEEITIKFGKEPKPTQYQNQHNIVGNHNFTRCTGDSCGSQLDDTNHILPQERDNYRGPQCFL